MSNGGQTPAIRLQGVTKTFASADDSYTAVRNIDLDVAEGSFVALVGPSGCGKSTILNMAAGLMAATRGRIEVYGDPLAGINRRAAYIFQQDAVLPWKTVLDNVLLGPKFHGRRHGEAKSEARRWLERVGLAAFANAYPYQLSGGMRKRVAIAQSWIVDPDILLMDEPFGALDVQTRQLMEGELLGIWSGSHKTIIFVTHDLEEAIALADEVVVLTAGPAAGVVGRYPVDLERPRDLMDIRTQPDFVELYRLIWSNLRDEVLKSYEQRAAIQTG